MTAITLSAPARPRGSRTTSPVRPRPAGPGAAPGAARPQRARSVAVTTPALRLTRRGRLLITALLAAAAVVASLFVGGVGLAGTHAESAPVTYVTVAPGETLWAIASEVAPDADRRDTVARILELNALQTSSVRAGQRIAVPAS